jgi:putative serine protease PepD
MFKLLGAAAVLTLLTALTACGGSGGGDGTEASHEGFAALRTPASASALQTQQVKIVETVSPEVVQIRCGHRLGSGVVFDDRGNVVTNAHVVGSASGCAVTLSDGDERSATVVGAARTNDLAVVQTSGDPPTPATFADSSQARIGDIVLAMGNPLGLRSSVTQGIVSAMNRSVVESNGVKLSPLIQTSAESTPETPAAPLSTCPVG